MFEILEKQFFLKKKKYFPCKRYISICTYTNVAENLCRIACHSTILQNVTLISFLLRFEKSELLFYSFSIFGQKKGLLLFILNRAVI